MSVNILDFFYNDGYNAFSLGKDEAENPHKNPSDEHEVWADGFSDAEEDAR